MKISLKDKVPRKKALAYCEKWLSKIINIFHRTCYVLNEKVGEVEKKENSLNYMEALSRKINKDFDSKSPEEKFFLMAVNAIEAAVLAAKEWLKTDKGKVGC